MDAFLVIQLARIGDIIQTKRLILSLQRDGAVHLVVDRNMQDLAKLVYPGAIIHPIIAHSSLPDAGEILARNKKTFAELASINFTKVYNLNRSPLSLALCSLFDYDQIIGYRYYKGQSHSSAWCRLANRWTQHRRSSPLNLVDFWACFHSDPIAPSLVNPSVNFPEANQKQEHKNIGIVLSGRESRRSLPPAVLAQCVESLFIKYKGPNLILIGGKADVDNGKKLVRHLRPSSAGKITDTSGKTSLKDLFELIAGLDLVFTPDTGAMHLAAHLGIPVMATFLSSAWAQETGPYGKGHLIWQANESCAPCLESAPCTKEKLFCLEEFKSFEFQSILSGRNSQQPLAGLTRLESDFDELGLIFKPDNCGNNNMQNRSAELRSFLKESLGLNQAKAPAAFMHSGLTDFIQEKDWCLPENEGSLS